jgi:hypothetical protein
MAAAASPVHKLAQLSELVRRKIAAASPGRQNPGLLAPGGFCRCSINETRRRYGAPAAKTRVGNRAATVSPGEMYSTVDCSKSAVTFRENPAKAQSRLRKTGWNE